MELQGGLNPSKCNDSLTISSLVGAGSWSTILADAPITFDSNHQAEGSWVVLQYDYDQQTSIVTSADLVYPMPDWDDRTVTDDPTDDEVDDDDDADDDAKANGSGSEDDDVLTRGSDAAVAAAVLCGVIVLLLVIILVKMFTVDSKSDRSGVGTSTEMASTKNALNDKA